MSGPDPEGVNHATVRDRIVALRRVRAGELRPNPRNWRRHPERQRRLLGQLLETIGYADALLAREEGDTLVLIDGHLRRSLDPDQVVPVLVLDLTEHEADELLVTLDPIAALARPDADVLEALQDRVAASGAAVRELMAELLRQAGVPPRTGLVDPDEVPVDVPTRAQRGDLWALGPHRVLCGDTTDAPSVERLMAGTLADACWTDPPYGIDYVGKTKAALRLENDAPSGLRNLLDRGFAAISPMLRSGAAIYIAHPAGPLAGEFLGAFQEAGWLLRQTLVWVKDQMVLGHGDYHYRHEPILYGHTPCEGRWGRGQRGWYGGHAENSVFEIARPRASREHPTAKPVELVRRCLQNSTAPGDVVLDPFLGSGTTLVAAHQLGRFAWALEVDPRYLDVAIARWESFSGERAELIDGVGR